MRRLGQPGVIGELLGGFIVGPYGLGLVQPGETALVFAEMGVVILLFSVGLEVRTDDLLKVGKPAILTAIIAMILPIIGGFALTVAMGETTMASFFVGLALAATSIGITSRVLRDMGVLDRTFAKVVIGAALVDDILALILIGLAAGAAEGDLSANTLLVGVAGIGLVLLGFAVARRARGLKSEVFTWPLFADTPLVPAFLIMLAVALLSAAVGLAAIIGAFVAGLIVAETEAVDEIERDIKPLALIFTPFFFAVTGAQLDLSVLLDPRVAAIAVPAGADRHRDQGHWRVHRRVLDRALGSHDGRLRDGAPRRGGDRGREPRPGHRRGGRRPVRRDAGRGGADDRRGALPAGLGRAQGEGGDGAGRSAGSAGTAPAV